MRVSIWHRTEEKQPDKSDYYLTYRGWGMGGKADGDSDNGYLWYDAKRKEWRDYSSTSMGHSSIVYYWTDADPAGWVDSDPPSVKIRKDYDPANSSSGHPAVLDAWRDVEEAIKRFETVKALCQK
jgi:hypothetical protein